MAEQTNQGLHPDEITLISAALYCRSDFYKRNRPMLQDLDLLGQETDALRVLRVMLHTLDSKGKLPGFDIMRIKLERFAEGCEMPSDRLVAELEKVRDSIDVIDDNDEIEFLQDSLEACVIQGSHAKYLARASDHAKTGEIEKAHKEIERLERIKPNEAPISDMSEIDLTTLLDRDEKSLRGITGFPTLDQALGGLKAGTLTTFIGLSGTGKSAVLGHIALSNWQAGRRVLFVTLENTIDMVHKRIIQGALGVSARDLYDDKVGMGKLWMTTMKRWEGSLKVREFRAEPFGRKQLEITLRELSLEGWKPDVIIVDYIGEMDHDPKQAAYEWQKQAAKDFKSVADLHDVALVTAAQANRKAIGVGILSAEHLAECFGVLHVSDTMVTINRDCEEEPRHLMRLYLDKNRNGRKDVLVRLKANFRTMTFAEMSRDDYEALMRKPLASLVSNKEIDLAVD